MDILWATVCTDYHKQMYVDRRFSTQLLTEQSSLIKSLVIDIQSSDRANWRKHIFRTCSELACSKIYRIFKDVFKCETRVSVEFILETNDEKIRNLTAYVNLIHLSYLLSLNGKNQIEEV